jgi:hypothetical protein
LDISLFTQPESCFVKRFPKTDSDSTTNLLH